MNVKMNKPEGQVIIAALMPHAPVLVPAVGGKRGNLAAASVNAMTEAARRTFAQLEGAHGGELVGTLLAGFEGAEVTIEDAEGARR